MSKLDDPLGILDDANNMAAIIERQTVYTQYERAGVAAVIREMARLYVENYGDLMARSSPNARRREGVGMSTDGATPLTDAFLEQWDSYNYPEEAIDHARKLEGDRADLVEALHECINWFADRADASDEDGRGMRANEEMIMQIMCEAALSRAGAD